MKSALALIGLLALSGCGFIFGPGYSSNDQHYFAEPPVVVKKDGRYALRWRYGSLGFYFRPRYEVRNECLVFSLQGTTSTGSLSGREQELLIEGDRAMAALKKGGAFWWESDASLVPLTIKEEANHTAEPASPSRDGSL